jgi:hypothetical protein
LLNGTFRAAEPAPRFLANPLVIDEPTLAAEGDVAPPMRRSQIVGFVIAAQRY